MNLLAQRSDFLPDLDACISTYGDNWRAYYAAAECAHYMEFEELPEWGTFIQSVEPLPDGGYRFIHYDHLTLHA